MGLYQYNTEQLFHLEAIYTKLPVIEEPNLSISCFIQWLQQENQARKYLKIQRWEYGIYKKERIDECTDIPYLKTRLLYAPHGTLFKKAIEERLHELLTDLQ